MKCPICNKELIKVNLNDYICLKCKINFSNDIEKNIRVENNKLEPIELEKQDKKVKIIRYFSYVATIALFIATLVVCNTIITYNTRYEEKFKTDDYGYSFGIEFQPNDTYITYSGDSISSVGTYAIDDEIIILDTGSTYRIINHNFIQSSGGYIFEAPQISESFLIAFTVIFALVSLWLYIRNLYVKLGYFDDDNDKDKNKDKDLITD